MDGMDLSRCAKKLYKENKRHIFIVMITAFSGNNNFDNAYKNGVDMII